MQSFARGLVSKKKRRYKEHGFDLDLSYITPRIIAMGFPSEGTEGIYRNPLSEVLRLLTKFHDNHYLVFNLCSEREYDAEKFNGHVERVPFDDHQAAPLEVIETFCTKADAWLGSDPHNVIVVHCKAGKGRSGLMICALMLFLELMPDPETAMRFYGDKRTKNGKGVTIASQRRYVSYYHDTLVNGPRAAVELSLTQVKVTASIAVKGDVILVISSNNGSGNYDITPVLSSTDEGAIRGLNRQMVRRTLTLDVRPLLLTGDVKVQLLHGKIAKDASLFYCWFNTAYVEDLKWSVQRDEMDKPAKNLEDDLRLELLFASSTKVADAAAVRQRGAAASESAACTSSPSAASGWREGQKRAQGSAALHPQSERDGKQQPSASAIQTQLRNTHQESPRRSEHRLESPLSKIDLCRNQDVDRRALSLGAEVHGRHEEPVQKTGHKWVPHQASPKADNPAHPAHRIVSAGVETAATASEVERSCHPAVDAEVKRLQAECVALARDLEEERLRAKRTEKEVSVRMATSLAEAEKRHEAELSTLRGAAAEKSRHWEGEEVRWRERENELLLALSEACNRARAMQGELEVQRELGRKAQEEARVLRGHVERLRARSLGATSTAQDSSGARSMARESMGAASPAQGEDQHSSEAATSNGIPNTLSPRKASQTVSGRSSGDSGAEALRLSTAAWRIRAATEGFVGRAWQEPDKRISNEQVMGELQDSVSRMQTLMRELRKEQNVNGRLNAQIQSFLSGMGSSAFLARASVQGHSGRLVT